MLKRRLPSACVTPMSVMFNARMLGPLHAQITTFEDLFTRAEMRRIYVAVLDEAVALLEQAGTPYQLPMPVSYRTYRWMLLHAGPLAWWIAKTKNGVRSGSYPSTVADVEKGRTTEVAQLKPHT